MLRMFVYAVLAHLSVFQEGVQCWRPLHYSESHKEKKNTGSVLVLFTNFCTVALKIQTT